MHKLLLPLFCAFALLFGCGGLRSTGDAERLTSKRKTSFDHFGTACFAVVFDDFGSPAAEARFEAAWKEIYDMLTRLEKSVSVDLSGSDIHRFNRAKPGERVAVNEITAEITALAIEMHRLTNGAYNPAVANLVDLWGFSPRFRRNGAAGMPYDRARNADGSFDLPDPRYVRAFRALSDFSGVELSGNEAGGYFLVKTADELEVDGVSYSLQLDFGGIAKGWGADKAAEILKKHGYEYGYVNLGLSSLKLLKRNVADQGVPRANMWAVGLLNPVTRTENYLSVFGKDIGVSTSGGYDASYKLAGREYSHIIDPATGEPTAGEIASAIVVGEKAGSADALTTAICVMGKEKAREFMNGRLKGYRAAFLARRGDDLELVTNMTGEEYSLNRP